MQMKKVELGTFDCGACQVAFTEKAIRFYTDEAPRFQPRGYPEEIELDMSGLTNIQIDKQRGLMCVTGFFEYDVPGHYSCYAAHNVQSRALFHFNTSEGDGLWSGSDRDKRVQSLMRLAPDIRNKTHFNPDQTDFAAELQRFKRRQTGEWYHAPPKPAAGEPAREPALQPSPHPVAADRAAVVRVGPTSPLQGSSRKKEAAHKKARLAERQASLSTPADAVTACRETGGAPGTSLRTPTGRGCEEVHVPCDAYPPPCDSQAAQAVEQQLAVLRRESIGGPG